MRERLLHHLRQLPQIVETWNRPDDGDAQPSQFARSLTKVSDIIDHLIDCLITIPSPPPPLPGGNLWLMWFWSRLELLFPAINFLLIRFSIGLQEVSYLQRILSRTLHEVDVHAIFRCVSIKLVYWTACFLVFMVHKMVLGIPFLQASCHNLPFNNFRVIFSLGH